MFTATTTSALDLPGSAECVAVPSLKILMTENGHICTFRVAEGGVHECGHGQHVLPDDVPAASDRAGDLR